MTFADLFELVLENGINAIPSVVPCIIHEHEWSYVLGEPYKITVSTTGVESYGFLGIRYNLAWWDPIHDTVITDYFIAEKKNLIGKSEEEKEKLVEEWIEYSVKQFRLKVFSYLFGDEKSDVWETHIQEGKVPEEYHYMLG